MKTNNKSATQMIRTCVQYYIDNCKDIEFTENQLKNLKEVIKYIEEFENLLGVSNG